ncbi:MAG: hypothetical protein HY782_24655 [Chloroflexi bacterium]|nr:hypothetical protein [Chloroflexota bacterium]
MYEYEEQSQDTSYEPAVPDTISGSQLMASAGLWTGGFWHRWHSCMSDMGLPAPESLFGTFTTAVATIAAIYKGVETYGTAVTIAELIGAGVLADALIVAGALSASFYAGACVGCLATAGIDMSGIF